ncbi:pentapeptide repeat-containing protein [Saccharopolyspora sp. ID03-671]|uniref:pentapeptide repeat-containing protein n=1 Tax=Saccharopolyspora sp. ID03-671 TaxID=3073066 RepID=UPI0032503108
MLAQWRILLTGLFILSLAGIAGSTVAARRRLDQEAGSDDEAKPLLREIPGWAIWAGMACLVAVGLLATWWLVTSYGSGDSKTIEQNRVKLEAIKLAGSVVVGTGGVAALLLAARRQRVSELDLLQRDRVADDNRHDANERRATELYTAAAEQLASDKAPVRMAGMYALSRLGENNHGLRQTIINLLCAYLRMPDISIREDTATSEAAPGDPRNHGTLHRREGSPAVVLDLASAPLAALTALAPDLSAQRQQERQVRLTAQRILVQHLQPRRYAQEPTNPAFWPDMNIDLSMASLHEWNFIGCEVRSANFKGTNFYGDSWFNETRFYDDVDFDNAKFHDAAVFKGVQFHGWTTFQGSHFYDAVNFDEATFHDYAFFLEVHFHGPAGIDKVEFCKLAGFDEAQFYVHSWFDKSQFHEQVLFNFALFHGEARFDEVEFRHLAGFENSHFYGDAKFIKARFHRGARFDDASFDAKIILDGTRIWSDASTRKSVWPPGWSPSHLNLDGDHGEKWDSLVPEETFDGSSAPTGD